MQVNNTFNIILNFILVTLVYMQYEKNVNENEMREQHRGELNNNNKKN